MVLWERVGAEGPLLPKLAVRLVDTFQAADAIMLEANPLAIDAGGDPSVVVGTLEIDDNALFRHPAWAALRADETLAGRRLNERAREVAEASRRLPAGRPLHRA